MYERISTKPLCCHPFFFCLLLLTPSFFFFFFQVKPALRAPDPNTPSAAPRSTSINLPHPYVQHRQFTFHPPRSQYSAYLPENELLRGSSANAHPFHALGSSHAHGSSRISTTTATAPAATGLGMGAAGDATPTPSVNEGVWEAGCRACEGTWYVCFIFFGG